MRTVVEILESGLSSSGVECEGFDGLGGDGFDDGDGTAGAAGADDGAGAGADGRDVVVLVVSVVFVKEAIPVGVSCKNKDVGYRPVLPPPLNRMRYGSASRTTVTHQDRLKSRLTFHSPNPRTSPCPCPPDFPPGTPKTTSLISGLVPTSPSFSPTPAPPNPNPQIPPNPNPLAPQISPPFL